MTRRRAYVPRWRRGSPTIRRIKVIAPEAVAALPDGRLDLIVTNSVAQYLTDDELTRLLAMFRRLLAPTTAR